MFKLGTNKIGKIFLGNTGISKAYLGIDLVFDSGSTPPTPTWEEVTLTYTAGHSFTLKGVTFTYDSTNNVYTSSGVYIYPSEIILTLDPDATTSQAYDVLFGGTDAKNEVWMAGASNQHILSGIRFDGQVTRSAAAQGGNKIYEIHLKEADKSILLNGAAPNIATYSGQLKLCFINGRGGSYHTDCNKVLKIKVI